MDGYVPKCTRGAHRCTLLCPDASGLPCSPPSDSSWVPHTGAPARHYVALRDALGGDAGLTERQRRYLRWLAGCDEETVDTVASLFVLAKLRGRSEP